MPPRRSADNGRAQSVAKGKSKRGESGPPVPPSSSHLSGTAEPVSHAIGSSSISKPVSALRSSWRRTHRAAHSIASESTEGRHAPDALSKATSEGERMVTEKDRMASEALAASAVNMFKRNLGGAVFDGLRFKLEEVDGWPWDTNPFIHLQNKLYKAGGTLLPVFEVDFDFILVPDSHLPSAANETNEFFGPINPKSPIPKYLPLAWVEDCLRQNRYLDPTTWLHRVRTRPPSAKIDAAPTIGDTNGGSRDGLRSNQHPHGGFSEYQTRRDVERGAKVETEMMHFAWKGKDKKDFYEYYDKKYDTSIEAFCKRYNAIFSDRIPPFKALGRPATVKKKTSASAANPTTASGTYGTSSATGPSRPAKSTASSIALAIGSNTQSPSLLGEDSALATGADSPSAAESAETIEDSGSRSTTPRPEGSPGSPTRSRIRSRSRSSSASFSRTIQPDPWPAELDETSGGDTFQASRYSSPSIEGATTAGATIEGDTIEGNTTEGDTIEGDPIEGATYHEAPQSPGPSDGDHLNDDTTGLSSSSGSTEEVASLIVSSLPFADFPSDVASDIPGPDPASDVAGDVNVGSSDSPTQALSLPTSVVSTDDLIRSSTRKRPASPTLPGIVGTSFEPDLEGIPLIVSPSEARTEAVWAIIDVDLSDLWEQYSRKIGGTTTVVLPIDSAIDMKEQVDTAEPCQLGTLARIHMVEAYSHLMLIDRGAGSSRQRGNKRSRLSSSSAPVGHVTEDRLSASTAWARLDAEEPAWLLAVYDHLGGHAYPVVIPPSQLPDTETLSSLVETMFPKLTSKIVIEQTRLSKVRESYPIREPAVACCIALECMRALAEHIDFYNTCPDTALIPSLSDTWSRVQAAFLTLTDTNIIRNLLSLAVDDV